jgi:type II secretory pathway pseudopilin PulG
MDERILREKILMVPNQALNHKKRGFSLVEVMVGTGVMVMFLLIIAEGSGIAATFFNRTRAETVLVNDFRRGFELMVNDIRESQGVLVQYPTSTPTFSSSESDTIILRMPKFTDTNELVNTSAQVKIYRIESKTGADGPFVLKLYTANINNYADGDVTDRGILVKNVVSSKFAYVTNEYRFGDYWTKAFSLAGTPVINSQTVTSTSAIVGGVNRLTDGWALIDDRTLRFELAPKSGVPIDISYHVSPDEDSGTLGLNPANMVEVRMTIRAASKDRGSRNVSRDTDLGTKVAIINR